MNRPLSFFVPWVCAAWLASCAAPVPQAPPVRTAGIAAVAPGTELHHPRPGLVTSGQPAAADWAPLAAQGIRTVVNLRPVGEQPGRDEASEVRAAGMRYIDIPVANADAINPENARRLHQALSAAYRDGPVLLHCASANRAGGLLALALVTEHGMPLEDALEIGRKAGMKSTEAFVRKVVAGQ